MKDLVSNNGGLVDHQEIEENIDINELCMKASARAHVEELKQDKEDIADKAASYLESYSREYKGQTSHNHLDSESLVATSIYAARNLNE